MIWKCSVRLTEDEDCEEIAVGYTRQGWVCEEHAKGKWIWFLTKAGKDLGLPGEMKPELEKWIAERALKNFTRCFRALPEIDQHWEP